MTLSNDRIIDSVPSASHTVAYCNGTDLLAPYEEA